MPLSANFSTTNLDLRFDQTDINLQGQLVNSFAAVKPIIDRIKAAGFDAVTLQTNCPIDVRTGEIDLWVEQLRGNQDRSLPKDFWLIADYAKKVGLQVIVKAEIVDSATDNTIHGGYPVGPGFSWSVFWQSVATYQAQLAAAAQKHGVDGFYVGYNNGGLTGENNRANWQAVVDAVRKNFSGSLIYSSDYTTKSAVVWDMVDIVGVGANPVLSTTDIKDLEQIIARYSMPEAGLRGDIVAAFRALEQKYKKPIIFDGLMIAAGDKVIGDVTNNGLWQSLATTGQVDSTRFELNYDRQVLRYKAALELIANQLKDTVDAISVGEYSPWQQSEYIMTHPNSNWGIYSQLGINIMKSDAAERLFTEYFNQPWGYKTLWYGTSGNDVVRGMSGNDLMYAYGGNDTIDGGAGVDTMVIAGNSRDYRLLLQDGNIAVQNQTGNRETDVLIDVEKIQFSNRTVDLQASAAPKLPDNLYGICAVLFGTDINALYLSQLQSAVSAGLSVRDIVQSLTTKPQFLKEFYGAAQPVKFATKFVEELTAGSTVSADAKQKAVADIADAVNAGVSVADVIITVYQNLNAKSYTDSAWGSAARALDTKTNLFKVYASTLSQDPAVLNQTQVIMDHDKFAFGSSAILSIVNAKPNDTFVFSVNPVGTKNVAFTTDPIKVGSDGNWVNPTAGVGIAPGSYELLIQFAQSGLLRQQFTVVEPTQTLPDLTNSEEVLVSLTGVLFNNWGPFGP